MKCMGIKKYLSAAVLLVCMAAGSEAKEWTENSWEQTVYYRYTFNVPAATQALLRLTAVDEYEVFLNGERVGGDADWTTMEEYAVELVRRNNNLAVRVVNRGGGEGSGLVAEVSTEEQVWVSASGTMQELWYWSGAPQLDDAWLTANVSRLEEWTPVQRGRLDRGGVVEWADTLGAEVVAGFPGGVDLGRAEGGISLRSIAGENLAFRLPSNRSAVFDGRSNTGWNVDSFELNALARVDLLRRRLLSEVRVFTQGRNAEQFAENSLRGYAVQVSNDGFFWKEMGVLHRIDQYERTAISFEPVFARFLQVVIAEVDAVKRSKVAEIQVLGAGLAPAGSYLSEPLDLGSSQRKSFARVHWSGAVPGGTRLSLQFRSSDDGESWSAWSPPLERSPAHLLVPEPRKLLQYRVNLATDFEDVAPRLDSLRVEFSDQLPASLAQSWVEPNQVVLGRDTLFTYRLELDFGAGDLGVQRLMLKTPSRAEVDKIVPPAGVEVVEIRALGNALELLLAAPWKESGTLEVHFQARLLASNFEFRTQVFDAEGSAVLDAEEHAAAGSWRVAAVDAEGPMLSQMRAVPAIFSPNGDGINDATVIEFTLARVSEAQEVEVGIFDLRGRQLRTLHLSALSAGQYLSPPAGHFAAGSPGLWDGRDESGKVVAPGLYLARLRLLLGREEEILISSIAVVY